MNKHLAGLHDQKTHGRNNPDTMQKLLSHLQAALGSVGTATFHNGNQDLLDISYPGTRTFALVWPFHSGSLDTLYYNFNNTRNDFLYPSPDEVQMYLATVKAVETAGRAMGSSKIQTDARYLPVVVAAKSGYYIKKGPVANLAVRDFEQLIQSIGKFFIVEYQANPINSIAVKRLADKLYKAVTGTGPEITAKTLLNIRHPDNPDVSLFLEYMLRYGKDQPFYRLTYIKDLK